MIRSVFKQIVVIDTSAVLALHDPHDQFHRDAIRLFSAASGVLWDVLDSTSHECFTRARYAGTFQAACEQYSFMRRSGFRLLRYDEHDEVAAEDLLQRYSEHTLSFHDALCAGVMKRLGIFKIFTFDTDFSILGFEVMPGATH